MDNRDSDSPPIEDVLDEILENNPYDPLLEEELNGDEDEVFSMSESETKSNNGSDKQATVAVKSTVEKVKQSPSVGEPTVKSVVKTSGTATSQSNRSNLITLTGGGTDDQSGRGDYDEEEEEESETRRGNGKFTTERKIVTVRNRSTNRDIPDSLDKVVVPSDSNAIKSGNGVSRRGGIGQGHPKRGGANFGPPRPLFANAPHHQHGPQGDNRHFPSGVLPTPTQSQHNATPKIHINPRFRHQFNPVQRFPNAPEPYSRQGGILMAPPQQQQLPHPPPPQPMVNFNSNNNHPQGFLPPPPHHPGHHGQMPNQFPPQNMPYMEAMSGGGSNHHHHPQGGLLDGPPQQHFHNRDGPHPRPSFNNASDHHHRQTHQHNAHFHSNNAHFDNNHHNTLHNVNHNQNVSPARDSGMMSTHGPQPPQPHYQGRPFNSPHVGQQGIRHEEPWQNHGHHPQHRSPHQRHDQVPFGHNGSPTRPGFHQDGPPRAFMSMNSPPRFDNQAFNAVQSPSAMGRHTAPNSPNRNRAPLMGNQPPLLQNPHLQMGGPEQFYQNGQPRDMQTGFGPQMGQPSAFANQPHPPGPSAPQWFPNNDQQQRPPPGLLNQPQQSPIRHQGGLLPTPPLPPGQQPGGLNAAAASFAPRQQPHLNPNLGPHSNSQANGHKRQASDSGGGPANSGSFKVQKTGNQNSSSTRTIFNKTMFSGGPSNPSNARKAVSHHVAKARELVDMRGQPIGKPVPNVKQIALVEFPTRTESTTLIKKDDSKESDMIAGITVDDEYKRKLEEQKRLRDEMVKKKEARRKEMILQKSTKV